MKKIPEFKTDSEVESFLEQDLFKISLNPGPELNGIEWLGIAGEFQTVSELLH